MYALAAEPKITRLKDYKSPAYLVETVDLTFELEENFTLVTAQLQLVRNSAAMHEIAPLILNGEQLELVSLQLNGKNLTSTEYQLDAEHLIIPYVPEIFSLRIVTKIKPQENTELSGLYRSNNIFCTQCEAEGFRRIMFFPDRPDILARYSTTIIANKERYPVLLSNGNKMDVKGLPEGRHQVTWKDPIKKPCYLFALVAGQLDCLEDQFITGSGRTVSLQVFVDKGQVEKAYHAMHSIKEAMRWDEEAYGREYDLDIFMVVAIHDFNAGAMENKGLNLFNAKYILVKPETATDADYEGVLVVVGHEYLHNWSGNRVTCRDWFQLSLKEGLTVFREQEFTEEKTSALVARINAVRMLRNLQFREDAGPLAHPVQPDSYLEIRNFYTMTIYEKGAEVIRMLKVLLGPTVFRQAMDLYFATNDGCAVTIEEFVQAMEQASGRDLSQFRLWYQQAGTPQLAITSHYDEVQKEFALTVKQTCLPTPGQPHKKPLHIPVVVGLLDKNGRDLPLQLKELPDISANTSLILEVKNETETFHFINIPERPLPSLLRGFSAPVKIQTDYSNEDLYFLLAHDSDGFNQWEASQQVAIRILLQLIQAFQQQYPFEGDSKFFETYRNLLKEKIESSFLVELLTLPSESYLGELMTVVDVDAIHQSRNWLRQQIALQLKQELLTTYQQNSTPGPYEIDLQSIAKRRLKNTCLTYLMLLEDKEIHKLCSQQFKQATNMTDQLGAFAAFINVAGIEREQMIQAFYNQWQHETLVLDKWFAIQARCELPGTLQRVRQLLEHPAFQLKNPNKVRSLIGVFCNDNLEQFHAKNGGGYEFLTEQVLQLDALNPQMAARLLTPMTYWRRYDSVRQNLMRTQLEQIIAAPGLSKDVYEIAMKSLG